MICCIPSGVYEGEREGCIAYVVAIKEYDTYLTYT